MKLNPITLTARDCALYALFKYRRFAARASNESAHPDTQHDDRIRAIAYSNMFEHITGEALNNLHVLSSPDNRLWELVEALAESGGLTP